MDGNGFNLGNKAAKDLTAEIDRATDLAAAELTESKANQLSVELERDQASKLGNKILSSGGERSTVLTYNPEQSNTEDANTERTLDMAEKDNGYGDQIQYNHNTVGEESAIQTQERLNDDLEDWANEIGTNGKRNYEIMKANGRGITKEYMQRFEKIIAKHEYHPWELEHAAMNSSREFVRQQFGRDWGDRN